MSKGFIDCVFTISNYDADAKVVTRALLRKKGSNAKGTSISITVLKQYHEIKKLEFIGQALYLVWKLIKFLLSKVGKFILKMI